ncbi:aminoglycoside phosphotransferase APH(3') [Paenibacillus caseinilyticus]|uniref:Aminoglycoside phosphotransferase n=1 Tax=Paenibacillus mucilaginosus K02 TaxID=997761 RepID=I0BJG5_9BACL|nr:aminoglycoside phosphotransferase APH(3') [Paenibacillus mucilaginosus]AFH62512.1 aminoglycoside phosphotransferase [Paenibacillus mucilaginosus K02]
MVPLHPDEIHPDILKLLGEIHGVTYPRQGHTSDVGIIVTGKGSFVLKRTRGRRFSDWLRREAGVLEHLTRTALPVPKVYCFAEQEHGADGLHAWLLMQHLPGESLRSVIAEEKDEGARHKLLRRFGAALKELHSTPCPAALRHDGGRWLDHMLAEAEHSLTHERVDGTAELLKQLKANRPREIKQTLIHGDFTVDNVLVHEGRISGIIDWSGGALGDPRYDVSLAVRPKMNLFHSAGDFDAFYGGYGARILTDEDYAYFENGLYAFF